MEENNFQVDLTKTEESIPNIRGVFDFLTIRGWHIRRMTLYRNIEDRKLKRSADGTFSITNIEKYARKNLKCLEVFTTVKEATEIISQAEMKKMFNDTAESIPTILSVVDYLTIRGWYISKTTLSRHVEDRKLKRSWDGTFSIINIQKYARKHLRCLDVIPANAEAMATIFQKEMQKFFNETAAEIVDFVAGDSTKIDEFKSFLMNGISEYFKLRCTEKTNFVGMIETA
jgi:histone H3/H4